MYRKDGRGDGGLGCDEDTYLFYLFSLAHYRNVTLSHINLQNFKYWVIIHLIKNMIKIFELKKYSLYSFIYVIDMY